MQGGLNTYGYAIQSPINFADPNGLRSIVNNGNIYILPEDKSVPQLKIQNNVGAQGVSTSDAYFHIYDITTRSNLCAGKIGDGFANNPTPGVDRRATPDGVINDVGNIPTVMGRNLVKSYLIPSPDPTKFTNITVNYTIDGEHGLDEGFVVRYGVIGQDGSVTLRSYGEGNNFRQTPILDFIWGPQVETIWQQNHQEIIRNAR